MISVNIDSSICSLENYGEIIEFVDPDTDVRTIYLPFTATSLSEYSSTLKTENYDELDFSVNILKCSNSVDNEIYAIKIVINPFIAENDALKTKHLRVYGTIKTSVESVYTEYDLSFSVTGCVPPNNEQEEIVDENDNDESFDFDDLIEQ